MKRFRRGLFNGLAALSLLLCAATIALWARSHWRRYEIQTQNHRLDIDTGPDRIWLNFTDPPYWAGIPF